jgi:transcriptional regulator with XRE-family HTH domain
MIGDRIRTLREQRAWTQAHLAEASGVSMRTIQRLETLHSCSPETLLALAAAFDVDIRDLTDQGRPATARTRHSRATITAIIALILPALLFAAANLLKFAAGWAGPFEMFAAIGERMPILARVALSPVLILGGPVVALAVTAPRLLRLRIEKHGRLLAFTAIEVETAWPLIALLMTAGALLALLLGYVFVENVVAFR